MWNRLVKVVQYNAPDNGECVEVSYEYDALNHRISRNCGEETTKYAYGRNGALAYQEKTVDGNVTKRSFAYLNNEIVGFTDKAGEEEAAYYTVTDIQGSITEVYDGSSKLVWKSGYTAFGQLAGEVVDLIDFDGMYTGCDYDAETGLTYHWNRWRSEDGSCFITQDPIRDGLNWYVYCNGDPVNYFDNFGLSPKSALELISEKRDVINRVSEYYEVDSAGVASVIFQEKYHGIWAEAKNGLAYIAELGIHDKTDPATSFGLAEMQLQRAAALLGADIKQSGIKKEMYNELMKDDRSIALIALNIAENEKVLGFKLEGSAAGYAHNMGAKRYNDYLNQVENPPNDKIPKRSENYQEPIKDALNGIVDTRTDSERKNK